MAQPATKRLVTEAALNTRAAGLETPAGAQAKIDTAISGLINSAPGALDTLGEIATQLASDETATGALTAAVNARVPKWQPTTAYATGDIVMAPDGGIVQRLAAGTSGATYTAANWVTAPGAAHIVGNPFLVDQGILMNSTAAGGNGGPGSTDSTSRVTIPSYQTNGTEFFGEGLRMDLMSTIAKNMIAWRLLRPTGQPYAGTVRSVTWAGAHYYAQDQVDLNNPTDVHGHWSIEVPDATDSLRTRFEIKFADVNGLIGLDKTLVQTANADLVVDASNNQVLRLRTGAGAAKYIEYGNDQWGALPRWKIGIPAAAETGANVGSDFEIRRHNDAGVSQGSPVIIRRSSGRVIFGDTDGSSGGIDINRNSAGNNMLVTNTATGGTGYAFSAKDAPTSRTLQSQVQGESGIRAVLYADGKLELGDGTNARDTTLYRKAANQLATDDALFIGNVTAPTTNPVNGGIIYTAAGALVYRGSAGTVTTLAPA